MSFAHNGVYFGVTKGFGGRAELGIGGSIGVDTIQGKDNMGAECSGLLGTGLSGAISVPPAGSGEIGITGANIGAGFGVGGGCSIMWTDYTKIL